MGVLSVIVHRREKKKIAPIRGGAGQRRTGLQHSIGRAGPPWRRHSPDLHPSGAALGSVRALLVATVPGRAPFQERSPSRDPGRSLSGSLPRPLEHHRPARSRLPFGRSRGVPPGSQHHLGLQSGRLLRASPGGGDRAWSSKRQSFRGRVSPVLQRVLARSLTGPRTSRSYSHAVFQDHEKPGASAGTVSPAGIDLLVHPSPRPSSLRIMQ